MPVLHNPRGGVCLVGRAAGLLAAGLLLLPGAAGATDVGVDCNAGGSINATLATLDLQGPHTIFVIGTCTERVNIINRERVTIQAPGGQTATIQSDLPSAGVVVNIAGSRSITLRRLVVSGGSRGVFVSASRNVQLDACVLENNAFSGLLMQDDSLVTISGPSPAQSSIVRNNGSVAISVDGGQLNVGPNLIVENNVGQAMSTIGARVAFNAGNSENIMRNNGAGLSLNTSVVTFNAQNMIQNNGPFGVRVTGGEFFAIERVLPDGSVRSLVVEGHGDVGLLLNVRSEGGLFGRHKIRNNGAAPSGLLPAAGVQVFSNSAFQIGNGAEVTNNSGPGILADLNSTVIFGFQTDTLPAVVTGNTSEGLRLTMLSTARFFKPTTLSGGEKDSIFCDGTSVVSGDLTGILNVNCKIELGKK